MRQYRPARSSDASSHFTESLKVRPDDVDALLRIGLCAIATEQYDEATTAFRRALELVPNNGDAHRNLAWALFFQGMPTAQRYTLGKR